MASNDAQLLFLIFFRPVSNHGPENCRNYEYMLERMFTGYGQALVRILRIPVGKILPSFTQPCICIICYIWNIPCSHDLQYARYNDVPIPNFREASVYIQSSKAVCILVHVKKGRQIRKCFLDILIQLFKPREPSKQTPTQQQRMQRMSKAAYYL